MEIFRDSEVESLPTAARCQVNEADMQAEGTQDTVEVAANVTAEKYRRFARRRVRAFSNPFHVATMLGMHIANHA